MNYIATVNTPAHGTISVTYSDIEKNILGAWREEETIQLSRKEAADRQRHHLQPSIHAGI